MKMNSEFQKFPTNKEQYDNNYNRIFTRRRPMKIWYSVLNCGDGSAYPIFCESEKLAEIHQKYQFEGWGESCVGYLEVESDSPIAVKGIQTVEEEIEETKEEMDYDNGHELKEKLKILEELLKEKEENGRGTI